MLSISNFNITYIVYCYIHILLNDFHSGVIITGSKIGTTEMGDGTSDITTENVLDNYSVIYLNGDEPTKILFRCISGLRPIDSNNEIGDLYFNNRSLPIDTCNGFVEAKRADFDKNPGVLNIHVCGKLTTSTEGVYTCRLLNSSMMNQSVSVVVYFSGRSESFYKLSIC